jgi:DNA-binding response OmpR family regulator
VQILLVEDDRELRRFLSKAFREEGYGVTEADTGDRALERALVGGGAYGCIVLDVMLPGRDGFSVVSELRARGVFTPVLLLTARDERGCVAWKAAPTITSPSRSTCRSCSPGSTR